MKKYFALIICVVVLVFSSCNVGQTQVKELKKKNPGASGVKMVGVILEFSTGTGVPTNEPELRIFDAQDPKNYVVATNSGADGEYEFDELEVGGNYRVVAVDTKKGIRVAQIVTLESDGQKTLVSMPDPKELNSLELEVVVLDKNGDAVKDASVRVGRYFKSSDSENSSPGGEAIFENYLSDKVGDWLFDNVVTVTKGDEAGSSEFTSYGLGDKGVVTDTVIIDKQ